MRDQVIGSAPVAGTSDTESVVCPRCGHPSPKSAHRCTQCGYSIRETRGFKTPDQTGPEALIGNLISGKYRVVSLLGEGGFGVVYNVELVLFDGAKTFALKLLHPSLSRDRNFRRRFLREVTLAMQVIHEHTIQIREFGRTDDDQLYFTMDYCDGESLSTVIQREGCLGVNRAVSVTRQVLSVLQFAHARGIIHRDMKPENIFLESDSSTRDFVKVGDFGLAKCISNEPNADKAQLRETDISRGGILGTPRYMSPEQARGADDLDQRSDLYSVGVLLYEMLYGDIPGESSLEEQTTPNTPVGQVVPPAVKRVLRKSLTKDRRQRYQSAGEFLDELGTLPDYTSSYSEPDQLTRTSPWWKRFAVVMLILFGAGLLVTVGATWYPELDPSQWWRSDQWGGRILSSLGLPTLGTPSADADLNVVAQGIEPAGYAVWITAEFRSFAPYEGGAVLRYEVEGADQNSQAEVVYTIEDTEDGIYKVTVTPGDRSFRWVVNEDEKTLDQQFFLPNPETGELTEPASKPLLRLPRGRALAKDFTAEGLRMYARLVHLRDRFHNCLLVEQKEGDQVRYQYYKPGRGLVALEVYQLLSDGDPASASKVYGRYLITE